MKIIKKTYIYLLLTFILVNIVNPVKAAIEDGWVNPVVPTNVVDNLDDPIKDITNWMVGFAVALAVLMIIWGGILYLTSAGDENKAENGKKTISYGVIGIAVTGVAYAIVILIIKFTT